MREIKFRALSLYPQMWVYGLYFKSGSEGQWTEIQMENGASVYVDEETISQYTGLKDKNGKEIYEGDIVQQNYKDMYNRNQAFVGEVFYSDCVYWLKTGGEYTFLYDEYQIDESVVIGNIYENPELLDT